MRIRPAEPTDVSLKHTWLSPIVAWLACACAGGLAEPAAPLTPPLALCDGWNDASGCLDPRDAEHRLRRADLILLGATDAPGGRQGAKVLTLGAAEPAGRVVFRAKWRAHSTSHALNHPRHEVNAYALAKLVLGPQQTTVPPTSGHCFPLDLYRQRVDASATASFDGTRCVFGVLSFWMEDALGVDEAEDDDMLELSELFDPDLFWQSTSYRHSLADVNLVTFLISHGDSHSKQFVLTGSERAPSVHLVDNTIAFSGYQNPKIPLAQSWSLLRVPALSERSYQRLARLSPRHFAALAVVEQYENRDGVLVQIQPDPPRGALGAGLRWVGDDLQLGLTTREIRGVQVRAQSLLERVSSGRIPTFR